MYGMFRERYIIVRNKLLVGISVQGNYWNYLHTHANMQGSNPTLTDCYKSAGMKQEVKFSFKMIKTCKTHQDLLLSLQTV